MAQIGPIITEFEDEGVPDIYADAVTLETGIYGVTLTFGIARKEARPRARAKLRLSPQMAKVLHLLLRQQLKQYEHDIGRIGIPPELATRLGLETTEVY